MYRGCLNVVERSVNVDILRCRFFFFRYLTLFVRLVLVAKVGLFVSFTGRV